MTSEEKSYLAGLFDSRCYIGSRTRGNSDQAQIELCRDLPVLERVKAIIGYGSIKHYKSGYRYRLRGVRVVWLLRVVGEQMQSENRWALEEARAVKSR